MKNIKVVIDGNDGSGKTTIANILREKGFYVEDRGFPTKATDNESIQPEHGYMYFVLDIPVELSRERLKKRGANLDEKYHTVEDLTYYKQRFLDVAKKWNMHVIDGSETIDKVVNNILYFLEKS